MKTTGKRRGKETRKYPGQCAACGDDKEFELRVPKDLPHWKLPDKLHGMMCETCERMLKTELGAWVLKVAKKAAADAMERHEDRKEHYSPDRP